MEIFFVFEIKILVEIVVIFLNVVVILDSINFVIIVVGCNCVDFNFVRFVYKIVNVIDIVLGMVKE